MNKIGNAKWGLTNNVHCTCWGKRDLIAGIDRIKCIILKKQNVKGLIIILGYPLL